MKRRLRIWIQGYETENLAWISVSDTRHAVRCDNITHLPFELDHYADDIITINVVQGHVSVNNVEINHNWIINPDLQSRFEKEIQVLLGKNCDLNYIDRDLLDALHHQDLWVSSGESRFSATEHMIFSAEIDSIKVQAQDNKYHVQQGQSLSFHVYHPVSADSFITRDHRNHFWTPKTLDIEFRRHLQYDQMAAINSRLYRFVEKYLGNAGLSWHDVPEKQPWPYSHAIRIQTELIDNHDLIQDRYVVDFGCDRGQFLSACLDLGCAGIIGAQIRDDLNSAINQGLIYAQQQHRARAVHCDVYDLPQVSKVLTNVDTILFMGLIYHINHHYELFRIFTDSNATAIIIDTMINDLDWYQHSLPELRYKVESQQQDGNGVDRRSKDDRTWVGMPNASWIINTLDTLGWHVRSSTITSWLGLNQPQLRYRGTITATR